MEGEPFIGVARVAEITGYTPDTVRVKLLRGELPGYRNGGRGQWRALESEIRAAIRGGGGGCVGEGEAIGAQMRAGLRALGERMARRDARRAGRGGV